MAGRQMKISLKERLESKQGSFDPKKSTGSKIGINLSRVGDSFK
jgi:hypothetical protein